MPAFHQALLVSNLTARTVSPRLKQVIVKALSADLKLDVADTESRGHATELARDAADRGFDLVICFGGDGTVNEVANGLIGAETALALLPGGMANVLCRVLGVPTDIVEATGHLLNRIQSGATTRIKAGRADGRFFLTSCGIGIDAETVRRVEQNPAAKERFHEWYFLYSALRIALGNYRRKEPYIRITGGDRSELVVLALITNYQQLTYWKGWAITIAPKARLERGLDVLAMRRFPAKYIPPLFWTTFRGGSHVKWKHAAYWHDLSEVRLESSGPPFPIQVDGEFVGERKEIDVVFVPEALSVLI
jgi:diacylglycerol kinase family enzyme